MVFIVPPSGRTLSLDLNPNTTTLHHLKHEIQQIHGMPISQQRLFISQSLQLLGENDSLLISNLGVGSYSTLTLHVPFFGGTQPPAVPKPRFDFLNSKPPANYIAGLGRGATGITTRSDIGPARAAPDLPDRSATAIGGAAPAGGAGRGRGKGGEDEEDEEGEDKGYDERGIRALQRGVVIDREAWMKEAEAAERAGSVATCQAIIHNTIGVGVEEEDRKRTWVADAEECKKRGSIETARAIYAHALTVFLTKKSIWLKAAQLEKSHGTRESLDALLRKAVTYRPQAEVLWLMGAKEKWLAGDVPAARAILQEAYAAIPNSEEILLAAFKLEFENHEPERARMLLAKARERGGTERVWMKSAIVERELRNIEEERRLLNEGLKQFPSFFKLWLMLGQLEERLAENAKRQGQPEKQHDQMMEAKKVYEPGLKNCPNRVPLWLSLANLEEEMNGLSKARAVLTMGRKKNPQNPELWLAAVRAELKHGYKKEADILMAKALQECPNSGILWAASIEMVPRPQRKTKSMDALKKCDHDPHVIAAVAKLFWHDRKVDKARTWLNRAVTLDPDIGDFWALCNKFELQHGTEDSQKDVLKRCVAVEPKHGEKWQAISKAVENSHQPTESIMKKVGIALEN